jgi:hypothetical protein
MDLQAGRKFLLQARPKGFRPRKMAASRKNNRRLHWLAKQLY